jgi:hypothetical protein
MFIISAVWQIGFLPSILPVAANARIPPILVPPIQSNILCSGFLT